MKTNGMTMLVVAMAFAAHGAGQKTVHNLDAFPHVCESVAAVDGREPSLLPKGVKLGLVWHDEFDGYTLFIDGRQHGPKVGQGEGEAVSQTEEFVLLTTEAKWYRNDHMTGKGVPELESAAASGDEFLVDYVRVYDIEETE